MQTPLLNIFSHQVTPKHLLIFGGTFIFLTLLQNYLSGGKCRIKKDLNGKLAVITGGNAGIGKETALELAKNNCNLIIGARDRIKLEQTVKEIKLVNPKVDVNYCILDLGDKESIKQFSEFVHQNTNKIDLLINNAGVMMVPERRETKDGLQMQIGTNHFGHFYLTYALFPLLKKSQDFKIINVSSRAHLRAPKGLDFGDMQSKNSYNDISVYAKSKLANIYFSRYLQSRFQSSGISGSCYSLHPGVVRTELTRYIAWYKMAVFYLVLPLVYLFTKSPLQGAQTTLYLALQDKKNLIAGEYYADCKVEYSTDISKSKEYAQKLWNVTEQTWGVKFVI